MKNAVNVCQLIKVFRFQSIIQSGDAFFRVLIKSSIHDGSEVADELKIHFGILFRLASHMESVLDQFNASIEQNFFRQSMKVCSTENLRAKCLLNRILEVDAMLRKNIQSVKAIALAQPFQNNPLGSMKNQ